MNDFNEEEEQDEVSLREVHRIALIALGIVASLFFFYKIVLG